MKSDVDIFHVIFAFRNVHYTESYELISLPYDFYCPSVQEKVKNSGGKCYHISAMLPVQRHW